MRVTVEKFEGDFGRRVSLVIVGKDGVETITVEDAGADSWAELLLEALVTMGSSNRVVAWLEEQGLTPCL